MLDDVPELMETTELPPEDATVDARRRLLFLSHANPEDNGFAEWLATQLAIAGYEVWCDLTELLGGEKFWNDIPEAIDGYTFRFLFASTLESNRKSGTLRELDMALKAENEHDLKDFIVPLKVDAFPYASTQNNLRERNFIRFDENWSAGLRQLLNLLDREQTPRTQHAGPNAVSAWYERTLGQDRRVVVSNEKCYSNWFSLELPDQLYFHHTTATPGQLELAASALDIPYRIHEQSIVTFAGTEDVQARLSEILTIRNSTALTVKEFINDGDEERDVARFDARNLVSDLIRQAWDGELTRKDMRFHVLASGLQAWYFRNNQIADNKAYFMPPGGGRRTYRQLVGRKSKRTANGLKVADGNWHFAISASPQLVPFPRMVLRYHVIFTDDGETPWDNANRMHKARRGVCKNWWNKEWRDRLFAMCAALTTDDHSLALPVGCSTSIEVSMASEVFTSPWTYFEDGQTGIDETADVELVEEQSGEDEEDRDSSRDLTNEPGDDYDG